MRTFLLLLLMFLFIGCAPQPQTSVAPTVQKPCFEAKQLNEYSYNQLSLVAKTLREDQKNMDAFAGFMVMMKGTVDDYAQMIKSSNYIANIVGYLPVPYAGEVSSATKLISKTVLNLGGVASALNHYKKSTTLYLEKFEKLDRNHLKSDDLLALAVYADTKVMSDAKNLQGSLQEIGEGTAMMEATTQSISNALETTTGYFNQAKSFVGLEKSDKSEVVKNRNALHANVALLNQKIDALEKVGQNNRLSIAKARIYSELAVQLER